VGMSGITMPETLVRQSIARAINIIVQLSRATDGRRRVASICELTGMEGPVITMHEIFRFEQSGVDEDGQTRGEFRATGVRPLAMERIARYGVDPAEMLRSVLEGD
jgi:pilus assembly protein CpaF